MAGLVEPVGLPLDSPTSPGRDFAGPADVLVAIFEEARALLWTGCRCCGLRLGEGILGRRGRLERPHTLGTQWLGDACSSKRARGFY
jgi:hypothetical protein